MREKLGWPAERFQMSFQSRFGAAEWLKPYTDETIKALAAKGVKRLAVLAPGFSADCLETLEELDVENREYFMHAGGERFAYLPCLNDSEEGDRRDPTPRSSANCRVGSSPPGVRFKAGSRVRLPRGCAAAAPSPGPV